MDFEKVGIKKEISIECPERQVDVNSAVTELGKAFKTLGIENWKLPELRIIFLDAEELKQMHGGKEVLACTKVDENSTKILVDKRLSSLELEQKYINGLMQEDNDFIFTRILKHEMAHIVMWSVTGMEKQPATRLLDEGWASLVEDTKEKIPVEQIKAGANQILLNNPDLFNRCIDFENSVTFGEDLNSAEHNIGKAFLLWIIQEKGGKDKMIDLFRKSPATARRNDKGIFKRTLLNEDIHRTAKEYNGIASKYENNQLTNAEAEKLGKEWEGKQFAVAILEITKSDNLDEVRQDFINWLEDKNTI
ncbi:MAG: hypothetical protein WA055_00170 [Candidatus Moraniibacteriota bacterium]